MKCKYSQEFDKLVIATTDDELVKYANESAQLAYKCKKALAHYYGFLSERDFYSASRVKDNICSVTRYLRGVVQDLYAIGYEHDFGAQARRVARQCAREIMRLITMNY